MSNTAAISDKLLPGDNKKYVITVPEDFTMKEIAARLEYSKLIDNKTFFELAIDRDFLDSLGIKAKSIEGYLFPDTYVFNRSF